MEHHTRRKTVQGPSSFRDIHRLGIQVRWGSCVLGSGHVKTDQGIPVGQGPHIYMVNLGTLIITYT